MKAQIHNFSTWVEEHDPQLIAIHYKVRLLAAGFCIISQVEKRFDPHGYTCLFLLSESHFAIHTFPEHGCSYIELSSCVKKPFDYFVKHL
jgi:S-adenosylmethionine decarboxylase